MPMSERLVALLRAVNVGGRNLVPMAALREVFIERGHRDVTTHLNSGNIVFTPGPRDPSGAPDVLVELTIQLEAAIEGRFGFRSSVVLRTADEMTRIADRHPHRAVERDDTKLHVVFLAGDPDASAVAALDPRRSPPDEFIVDGREIYVWYPAGAGHSKLGFDGLGTPATARNWKTVTKLATLSSGA
jgi:uncharacterized protein (DUF1697 family)